MTFNFSENAKMIEPLEAKMELKYPKVFIVSSGRSGTTLLASMLNAGEDLYIPYESDFIARAYPYFVNKQSFDSQDYKLITHFFRITGKQNGWGMPKDYLYDFLCQKSPQTFSEVNAVICEAFHEREGTQNVEWGIKAPVLIASLDRIAEISPTSAIIHIVRDGRDVYLSYRKVHETSDIKFGPKGIFANALYWIDGLRRVEDFKKSTDRVSLFELTYENLLAAPAQQLCQLCEFIGIPYKSEMHEKFNENNRNQKVAPDQFKKSIHKKLNSGLDPKNTNKYLAQMSPYELFVFELITAPYLAKYQYELQYPWTNSILFSPFRRVVYWAARIFNDWRYGRRDRRMYEIAIAALQD